MTRYFPSSAAFQRGRLTFTDYNAGCLRKIYLNNKGLREELKSKTKEVGAENEVLREKELQAAGTHYEREYVVKTDDFSGKIDFKLADRLEEHKSTQSENKRRRFEAGEGPQTENIAQLVAYMVELEYTEGALIYTYYPDPEKAPKKALKKTYTFAVTIDARGDIFINGARYKYNVFDHLDHRSACRNLDRLENSSTIDRPSNYDAPFGSPCSYCPFRDACDRYDAGELKTLVDLEQEAALAPNIVRRVR